MINDPDGIRTLQALRSCEAAQREGTPTDEAVERAAAAHQVDQIALLVLVLAKAYECDRARRAVADTRTADE